MTAGFTLMEIIVVIGIFVLLALLAIPAYNAYRPNLELKMATKDIIFTLKKAQQFSITEQIPYLVRFDNINDNYKLIYLDPGENIVSTTELPNNITYQSINNLTNDQVSFNAVGAPSDSGTIILQTSGNRTITVEIKPAGHINSY